jgi:hypothetical protein
VRVNLPALALSLAIVGGAGAFALRDFPLPVLAGARQGADETGFRRGPEAIGCRQERQLGNGAYAFEPPCAGQAPSPDGRHLVVRNAGHGNGVGLVRARDGASLADLGPLDDGMAFTIRWSPRSDRFFANHALREGGEQLRLFELIGEAAHERPALVAEARRVLAERHRCVADGDIRVMGDRWNAEGTRVSLVAEGRSNGCDAKGGGTVRRLSMVGDVASGRVDPASVRAVLPGLPVLTL